MRHLKCDTRSTCRACEKSGRECLRLNVRFRHLVCPSERVTRAHLTKYDFFFDSEQTWVDNTDQKLEFVVDSDPSAHNSLTSNLEDDRDHAEGPNVESDTPLLEQPPPVSFFGSSPHTPTALAFTPDDDPPDYLTASAQVSHDPPGNVPTASASDISSHHLRITSQLTEKEPVNKSLSSLERVLAEPELHRPLQSLQEGKLLQHWITHLAPWFDVGDSKRHFGRIVPHMATSSPLLMTAILAIAAFHDSRVNGQSNMYNAMMYHDRCLNMIVPMLSDTDPADEDSVLVTTTILHLYDGLESGNDLPRHLKGTSIFFPAEGVYNSSPLRRAVFWLHLRQEIYNAYLYQRGVTTDLSNCDFESEDDSGSDEMWFHQMLYIAALVSKLAFGEEVSHARWHELCKMLEVWESRRPGSFDPIYIRPRDPSNGRYFPEICYVTDEHVVATQFFNMAKVLLTAHDPSLPRIGPRVKSAAVAMQSTALSHLRTVIGIAICHNFMPARFTANLAIIICGNWFKDRQEQEALLDFMSVTSRCSGWSRHDAQQGLVEEWGWK